MVPTTWRWLCTECGDVVGFDGGLSFGANAEKDRSVGSSTWFSNAMTGLRRRHPRQVSQMGVDDKKKLYTEALGYPADCRPRAMVQANYDGPKIRLGSFKGCNPLVWQPRSIELARGILQDFDFRMIVDCYSGDGAWASANVQLDQPRPYVGMTMSPMHTRFLQAVVGNAVKTAMATDGHSFCTNESAAVIKAVCPDIMEKLQNEEEEAFPEQDEDDDDAVSDGE